MKTHTWLTLICCIVAAIALTLCASAANIADSGTCGDNLTWTFDSGVLTVSGRGNMDNWTERANGNPAPWHKHYWYIKHVIVKDGVGSIGDWAFQSCRLADVAIPDSVTSIGNGAFCFCSSLTNVTIPDSVTSIGDRAFWYCERLKSVEISDSITNIGIGAFSACSLLTEISVSSNNRNYMSEDGILFDKNRTTLLCCPGKKAGYYKIPDGVSSIGDYAFDGCRNLTNITISDDVSSIGYRAFVWCDALTGVTISDNVSSIGDSAFAQSGLTSVTIPSGVSDIGYFAFGSCSELTSVTISNGVSSIGDSAFSMCYKLASVVIPDSVNSIGVYAFGSCNRLTIVTIPNSVTSVGRGAFHDCHRLTDIYYGGSAAQWRETLHGEHVCGDGVEIHYSKEDVGIEVALTDSDGKTFTSNGEIIKITDDGRRGEVEKVLQKGDEVTATFGAADPDAIKSSELVTANVFLIFYDRDGLMVDLISREIDLSDPFNLMFVLDLRIPEGAKTLKFLMLGDNLEPLRAQRLIESSAA